MYELKRPKTFKTRKRVGCGPSSGGGKTCGRGMNGQRSRSGSKRRAWFEGGQMPLLRRVPKRGFTNIFKKEYQIVNLSTIEKLNVDTITPDVLEELNIIEDKNKKIKILGNGEITKSLNVEADAFTKSVIEKIEKANGKIIIRENLSDAKKK